MELVIKGTPDEIKNVIQAISGSEEHELKTITFDRQYSNLNFQRVLQPQLLQQKKIDPFQGLAFQGPAVSKKKFMAAYESYVKRCSKN
ncbi:hypothetical protein [Liquorilactobacillus hordei]|uniref:hypothetical protein n=1 Tax=Liquorilactobacillus hordei TaxID=468911 RepID=UPI0039EBDA34